MKSRLYNPAENVEILNGAGEVFAVFKDRLETVARSAGRFYGPLTQSSAQRLVRLMTSDKMRLELTTDGNVIHICAWRTHLMRKEPYKKDQWG